MTLFPCPLSRFHGVCFGKTIRQARKMIRHQPILGRTLRKEMPMLCLCVLVFSVTLSLSALTLATPSHAARCGGDFNTFIAGISADARAAGISPNVISSALGGVQQDGAVLAFDRRQRYTFNQSFQQSVSTRVRAGRINGGPAMMPRHPPLLCP